MSRTMSAVVLECDDLEAMLRGSLFVLDRQDAWLGVAPVGAFYLPLRAPDVVLPANDDAFRRALDFVPVRIRTILDRGPRGPIRSVRNEHQLNRGGNIDTRCSIDRHRERSLLHFPERRSGRRLNLGDRGVSDIRLDGGDRDRLRIRVNFQWAFRKKRTARGGNDLRAFHSIAGKLELHIVRPLVALHDHVVDLAEHEWRHGAVVRSLRTM